MKKHIESQLQPFAIIGRFDGVHNKIKVTQTELKPGQAAIFQCSGAVIRTEADHLNEALESLSPNSFEVMIVNFPNNQGLLINRGHEVNYGLKPDIPARQRVINLYLESTNIRYGVIYGQTENEARVMLRNLQEQRVRRN